MACRTVLQQDSKHFQEKVASRRREWGWLDSALLPPKRIRAQWHFHWRRVHLLAKDRKRRRRNSVQTNQTRSFPQTSTDHLELQTEERTTILKVLWQGNLNPNHGQQRDKATKRIQTKLPSETTQLTRSLLQRPIIWLRFRWLFKFPW